MSAAPPATSPTSDEEMTVAGALADAIPALAATGIEGPRREARLLLSVALGVDAAVILGNPDRLLRAEERSRFAALVARRAAHEPTARLRGRREFWSLDFALSSETLVPRPDSETVIEAVLAHIDRRDAPRRLLDLGTGSGCLLLALLSELAAASGIGIDISPDAALTAQRNAEALGLADRARFVTGSWAAALGGHFDVIVANPPYVPSEAIAGLAPEAGRFDPHRALDGGADGLDSYRALAPEILRLLREDGLAALEIGAGQAQAVAAIMRRAGLAIVEIHRDLAGIERCLVLGLRPRPKEQSRREAKKLVGKRHFPV